MNKKDLEKICKFARIESLTRGDAILCSKGYGVAPGISVPMLSHGDVCVATTFFSSGHINPDVYLETNKMYDCSNRCPYKTRK
ncbi:hypothetical protein JW756_02675 [Candidatus Woesearchaeota archaeon]|nr:hypothetical protein [Candidatus Woesearchaeota archaeon]